MSRQLWEERLEEVKRTGNFRTGYGKRISFFRGNYTQEEKENYCKRMIDKFK